jgi:hypothetical protein
MVDGLSSNFLLLLLGVDNFFTLGVWGDATTLPMILEPLPVFFSCHTTRSRVGDEETLLLRFPFIDVARKMTSGDAEALRCDEGRRRDDNLAGQQML